MKLATKKILVPILAVSISQLAGAAPINAIQTGNWSDPLSWDAPVPDTYLGATAVIGTGYVINYNDIGGGVGFMSTPAGVAGAGGFAIANGSTVTIDGVGSKLTQSTLNQEMRVGEGSAASGAGLLIISNGGTLDTGASIGLAVGAQIGGGVNGNGELDINLGTLILGAGAAAGGLGVGIDGSTGLLNVGNGAGAAGTSIVDLGTNNIQMGVGASFGFTGGTGTVNINSDGILTFGTGDMNIGQGGGHGTFNVLTGGSFTGGSGRIVVGNTGSVGTLTNAGTISNTGEIVIGTGGGTGTFTMTGGSLSTTGEFNIGRGAGSTGTGTVSGTVSASMISVGLDGGTGSLGFSAGGMTTTGDFRVALGTGATGTFTQSGGTLDVSGNHLQIADGLNTTGTFNITAGTVSNSSWIHIGSGAGSTGTLNVNFTNPADVLTTGAVYLGNNGGTGFANVSNGSLRATGVVEVGRYGGTGTLTVSGPNSSVEGFTGGAFDQFFRVGMTGGHGIANVTAGGKINTNGGWFTVGENNGSVGDATFSGAGSTLTSRGLIVGWNGLSTGTLNILDSAVVNNSGHEVSIGRDFGGANSPTGTINIDTNGVLNAGNDLRVGHNATGTVNITNGGTLNSAGGWAIVGDGGTANGTVNMADGHFNHPNDTLFIGNNPGAVGTFSQSGASTTNIGGELNLARDRSFGTLNVAGGTFNVNGWTTIGRDNNGNVGGMGTINVSNGGTFQHLQSNGGDLLLAWKGGSTGALNVTAGGKVIYNWWIRAGVDPGSQGNILVDGAGSRIDSNTGRVYIGEGGTGSLTLSNGGVFSHTNSDQFNVGGNDPGNLAGSGTVSIDATSSLLESNFIRVGHGNNGAAPATGVVNLTGGTLSSGGWIGFGHEGGDGTLNMAGGTLSTVNELYVGIDDNGHTRQTTGVANVSGASILNVGALIVGRSGGLGTFNLNGGNLNVLRNAEIGNGGVGAGGGVSTGTLNVDGASAVVNRGTTAGGIASDTFVGSNGGTGSLHVSNGGTFNTNWWLRLGQGGAASTGHITVDGAGSTINMIDGREAGHGGDNNAQLNIGEDGTGTLSITNGGTFNQSMFLGGGVTVAGGGEVHVARNPGSTGTLTIDGAGSTFNSFAREFRIADNNSTGTLNITNGGVLNYSSHNEDGTVANGNFLIAESNSANGTINMNSGTLNVKAWGFDSAWQDNAASSVATVNMVNSTLDIANDSGDHGRLLWGRRGTATINESGGTLHVGNWAVLGVEGGGRGNLNMSNGAVAQFDNELNVGRNGGIGTVSVATGSALAVSGEVFVGRDGNGSNGTLNVSGGSTVQLNSNLAIGHGGGGSTGLVNVTGAGTVMNVNGWTTLGRDTGGVAQSSTLNVSNGAVFNHLTPNTGDFLIGWQNGSTANVNVTNGGVINYSWWTRVGVDPGSVGSILVDNGSNFNQTGGRTYIGEKATGSLTITNNSHYTTTNADVFKVGGGDDVTHAGTGTVYIDATSSLSIGDRVSVGDGRNAGVSAMGTVNVNGGSVTAFTGGGGDFFRVGTRGGNGTVNVTAGGSLNTNLGWFTLGENDNSVGVATVDGAGSILAANGLIVGWNGVATGTLNIANNAVVTSTGREVSIARDNAITQGTINIASGGVLNGSEFRIGHQGTGTINVNAGTINASGWTILASDGAGTAVGTVTLANGSAFNQNGNRVDIGRNGTGSLTLTGGSTFTHTGASELNIGGNENANLASVGTLNIDATSAFSTTNFIRVGHGNAGASPAVGTVNLNGGSINGGNWIGFGHEGGDGTLNMTGGSITVNNEFYVGVDDNGHIRTTTGTANVSGGTLSVGGGAGFIIGRNGAIGVFNVTGTDPVTMTAANESHIGQGGVGAGGSVGNGTLNFSNPNATLTVANALLIGQDGGIGAVNQTAGTVTETNQWVTIAGGAGSTGTYNIFGGNLNANVLEVGADGNGVINVSGTAQVIANAVTVGTRSTGVGTINISGGLFKSNDHIALGGDQTFGSGTLNMTGGVVQTNFVVADAGVPTLNMDGGTFRASSNEGNYLRNFNPANSEILVGGVTFDTNSFNITAQNQMDGIGGLTKINSGTLTLTAQNLYTGVTTLNGGSLNVGSAENAGVSGPLGTSAAANPGSIVFGGGTLQYSAANQNDYSGRFSTALNQPYRVDTNGQNVTWATSLVSVGGSLAKFGAGTLVLPTANTYTAGTAIHGGIVNIISDAALGNATGGVLIDNNAILQAAAPVTSNRTFTLGVGGGQIDTNGQVVTLDTGSTVTGTSLTAADSTMSTGVLNIKGVQTYSALTTTGGVTNIYTALGTGTSTITANAALNIYASQTLASLSIADGVTVSFGDGNPFAPAPVKPLAAFSGGPVGIVPEPGSLGLLMVGALGFIARRRRSR